MRINLEHVREAKRRPFDRRSLQVGAFLLHGILWPGPLEGSFVLLECQGTSRCIIRGGVTFHPASHTFQSTFQRYTRQSTMLTPP